jgi:hypothetical protein
MISPLLRFILVPAVTLALTSGTIVPAQQSGKRRKLPQSRPKAGANRAAAKTQSDQILDSSLRDDPAVESADISITATVKARSLKFDVIPNATVEFPGNPQRNTVWEAERENLPASLQPGVTYRDIGVRLKITSVFSDIDRIVAEALGEVPADSVPAKPEATPPVARATSKGGVQTPRRQRP